MNHTTTVVDLNTIAASFPGMYYVLCTMLHHHPLNAQVFIIDLKI